MTALHEAQRRLDTALARLDAAIAQARRQEDAQQGGVADLAPDVAALRAECVDLRRALEASRRDNEELRKLADEVGGKLDGTIDELNTLLET